MRQFPLLTLQDILFYKTFNDKKIAIYLKECQKHNIVWIEGIIAEIFRIMSSTKIDPKSKIHTIFLLREVVKTCQYSVLYLVETYLSNILYEIAQYYAKNPQLQMNSKYFLLQGYNPSFPNLSQLSHNYVILGWEILYICAMIRAKQTFHTKELKKDSQFVITLNKIKQKNSKIFKQTQLHKKLSIPQLKLNYKKQLEDFYDHSYLYVDFYMKKLEDYVFSTQLNPIKEVLDFKILLKKVDPYLTSEAVARIAQIIDFVQDFKIKCKALSIINEMILWGDVQALITVNFTQNFQKIFRQFCKIDGSKGLKKGEQIFPSIKNQYEEKRKFYSDFLRCIQIWALSFPTQQAIFYETQQSNSPSPIFKNYRFLKQIRKFVFPQNPFQSKMELEIRQSFRNNSERNKLIIQDLNKEVQQIQDQYKVSFDEIKESMQNACKNLQKLKDRKVEIKNEMEVHAIMKFLIKFENTFQLQLERITQNVDENQLDQTIQKGLLCIDIINKLEPQYDKLKRGKIKMQQFISYCRKIIDLSAENAKSVSLNSSKSIHDRKSQLRNSIASNINKSKSSIKGMTQQTRIKIIRNKYLQRLNKIANRTNSDKDSSLSFSLYNNSRKSLDQQTSKLPVDSQNIFLIEKNDTIRHAKSDQKYVQNPVKSPRQIGKKMFVVTKFVKDNNEVQNMNNVKNKIIQQNWNSNKQIQLQKLKQPSIFEKGYHFSFIKTNQNIQTKQDIQSVRGSYQITPESGNTQTNQLSRSQDRKRFKKGVGLAKQFVNLTQKLIGPKKDIITFETFKNCFQNLKTIQNKKQYLSNHFTLINDQLIKFDRLAFFNGQKLIVTFYIIPKINLKKTKLTISETPSIYLNVTENKNLKVKKDYYQLVDLKVGQQYSFEITGTLLKAPITMPRLTININNQQSQQFIIPFSMVHMLKFKKPQSKWLTGKDFEQADKIISLQFQRNKQILESFSDIQDYFSQLVEIKTQQNGVKKYRTQAKIDKTSFLIQIKQVQNKMTFSACLLNETSNKSFAQYFVAQCMNLFS